MIYSLILPPLEIPSLTQPLKALKEIVSYRNSFSIQQINPKLYTNLNKPDSFLRDLTYRSLIPYRIRKQQRQRSLSCDLFYWSKKRKKSTSSVFFRNHPKHVHLLIIQSNRNCNFFSAVQLSILSNTFFFFICHFVHASKIGNREIFLMAESF